MLFRSGFIPSVIRGGKQLGSLVGDVLPAMVGKAVGAEDYAKKQMEEYAATQKEIQEKYPARVPSYKDIHSFGDAIDYAVESVGELIPSMLPGLITGGIGGIAARGLTAGAQAAARKELMKQSVQAAIKSGAYGGQKETLAAINALAKEAALKYVQRGQIAGAALSSGAQNIPEVYQNVYEATGGKIGGKEFAIALGAGVFNTALDTVLPATILKKITGAGLDPAEVGMAWYKRLAKGAPKGFMQEGTTETIQEMSSAAAESFVNENKKFFTEANFERFINAGLKGGLGGGVATGVTDVATGKGPEKKLDKEAKDLIEKTLEEAKLSDKEQEEVKTDIAKSASFEELSNKVKKIDKKIDDSKEISEEKKTELKDNIKEVADKVVPPAVTLTAEAKELLDIADTGAIPTRTDKQLSTIAKQNGVTFNPAIDTVQDLVAELRKLGEQDAERRDTGASGTGASVSGERTTADTEGTAKLDGTRVDGDESAIVADQDAERDQQFALEFNNWLAEKDISLASLDEQQFLDLEAQFEQERGGKEVIKPPVEEIGRAHV